MITLAWVLGRGGLLGSHVTQAIREARLHQLWCPEGEPLSWPDTQGLEVGLTTAIRAFLAQVAAGSYRSWSIFWCAGAGVVGSSPAELDAESLNWELFLSRLASELSTSPRLQALPGRVFLASSAGGVYAGNPERPLTESSAPCPVSPYGHAKLRQERALEEWVARRPGVSTLTGRISNLYGPGQNLDKPQGLISHMSRCLIHRQPIHIYVPMDTIRDYLFVEDAARAIVRWMKRLDEEGVCSGRALRVLKICASETETTIAGLVGVFQHLARRRLRVVFAAQPADGQQPARLQFRSTVWADEPVRVETSLLAGIDRLHRHQLALYQAGALPPIPARTGPALPARAGSWPLRLPGSPFPTA